MRSGLLSEVPDARLLWASRRWTPQASFAGSPEQPLFSVRARSSLDVYVRPPDYGNEHHILRAYGVAGEVRVLLAEAHLRSRYQGRALHLRNICMPEVAVVVEPYHPGINPGVWHFAMNAWGLEPADSREPAALRQTNAGEGASAVQTAVVSDVPCALHWLQMQNTGGEYSWAQLYDRSILDGPPEFTPDELVAQWLLLPQNPAVSVCPPVPLLLRRGAILTFSSTPNVWTDETGCASWAHWQATPMVHQPWAIRETFSGGAAGGGGRG